MEDFDQENHGYPDEKFLTRKSKKPLMEKRRRARINNCLTQLKALVLQAMKKDTTHYSKLEKADILEMTVKYLRNLQRRQISSAVAADPTVAAKFTVGFNECASEVARYLNNAHGINEDVRGRLLGHLSNCVQSTNSQQMQMEQAFVQPLHVQIPAVQNRLAANPGQSENLLVTAQTLFPAAPLNSSGVQIGSSFSVSPDSMFVGRQNTNSGVSERVDQKSYSHIPIPPQCTGRKVSSGPRPSFHYSESVSPEPIGFRPPASSSSDYKIQRFTTSPVFASASSALKEEKLWRPW